MHSITLHSAAEQAVVLLGNTAMLSCEAQCHMPSAALSILGAAEADYPGRTVWADLLGYQSLWTYKAVG